MGDTGMPRSRLLVVLVIAEEGLFDAVMIQQPAGVAGVLAGDAVRLAQHAHGPEGEILQVSDRRGDNVQRPGHGHDHCTA